MTFFFRRTPETKTTTSDLPPYLVTTTASSTPSFAIPKIPPPACNVSSSNMPPFATPNIPPPSRNVSSSNMPPYAPSTHILDYSGLPYMHFWPYQFTAPPSTTLLNATNYSTTTPSTHTVSYSTNAPSYQTVQAMSSRGPPMATSPIPTANHGLASPPSLTQIPVPPKFDFPPPFIPTTTPSLPDNQSLHLPPNFPSMPQQLTERQLQHPAVSVPGIAPRNSQHNMFVPPVAYPPLPSPNVNYPFQTQPVFVIGYFFNPNTCIPKVAASPVQTSIPPDCNRVYVAGSNAISHDGSNGSTCVLPAATSS